MSNWSNEGRNALDATRERARSTTRTSPPSMNEVAGQLTNQDVEYAVDLGGGWVQPFVITQVDVQQGIEEYGLGDVMRHAPVGPIRLTWCCQALGAPRRAR